MKAFERTEELLGAAAMKRLWESRVAVFGLGGVGGFVCEALARTGVGHLDVIDRDRLEPTNLNRQIIATHETLGAAKAEAMARRLRAISPEITVTAWERFFLPETAGEFPFGEYDCVVDAVDTVTAKLCIIEEAKRAGVPVVSAMGAAGRLDPTRLRACDVSETTGCPLARVMRKELKRRGISGVRVVVSEEEPLPPRAGARRPGSAIFVPAAMGLSLAREAVRLLLGGEEAG